MTRLWLKVMRRQKIVDSLTEPCAHGDEREALECMLKRLDLPSPIWLDKHTRELDSFRLTSFLPDHFVEPVPFDRIDVSIIEDNTRRSGDLRNDFS